MFELSFLLMMKYLLINILLPLIPGILFIRIFYGRKINGLLLYIFGRFIGVGVIAFSLFNIQFIHHGVSIKEYFFIIFLLVISYIIKIIIKKLNFKDYFNTLKINLNKQELKNSYNNLPKIEKRIFIIGSIFASMFLITTFVYRISLPTYGDDSFGNRNGPAFNIYQDGGVKLFGEKTEILGRGKLGYPIYIPVYKAVVLDTMGGLNDIYINMWQRLVFLGLILFVAKITWDKTKNIFYCVFPIIGIIGLPLVFFHSNEGYMELACATYSVLTIRSFWKFLEEKEYSYISLSLLTGFILSHIKNDGLLGYFAGILIGFILILMLKGNFILSIKGYLKDKNNIILSIFYLVFFFLPFLIVKQYHNLGFNQSISNDGGLGISSQIHTEIFSMFKPIFINMDNYNVIIILAFIIGLLLYKHSKNNYNKIFLYITPIIIFIIFISVFLLTENYIVAMNQTTINRVFTMAFVILLSFSGFLLITEGKD